MKSKAQQAFEEKRKHYTEREILMETLYATWETSKTSEKTRENTSTIVWIFVISIIASFFLYAYFDYYGF
ncbi:MAG: hypothetical protein AAF600_13110 [Bacteroidota bacterium]